jgi:amino-acid N-acetyltransferase
MSLGSAIRAQRKAQQLTLQALATLIDADSGNLSRIERGEQGITEPMLRKICTALNCTPAFLYAQSDFYDQNSDAEKMLITHFLKKQPAQNHVFRNQPGHKNSLAGFAQ